jgi:hypothetical protein
LTGVLVTSCPSTSASPCSSNYGSGGASQWLVVTTGFLLLLVVVAALSSNPCIGLATLAYLWGRQGMPCMALCDSSALVYLAKELSDILDVVRGELCQRVLIPHTLVKCNHNRCIGDTRDSVVNLRVGTLEVGCELAAQLSPGGECLHG